MTKFVSGGWSALAVILIVGATARGEEVTVPAVADEQAMAFITDYAAAVNARDVDHVNRAIDLSRLIDRSRRGLSVPPALLEGFTEGIRSGLDWGQAMVSGVGDAGHYRLLKLHRVDGQPRALLRLVNGQGGLNYHDVVLERAGDGRLVIADVYVYLSGEFLSDTIRRSLRQILAATQGGDPAYLRSIGLLEAMTAQTQAGEYADALSTYERMPPVMQADKTVFILRISCATEIGSEALDRACVDFRRTYPDDPCIDLLTIDRFILNQRWEDAVAAFRRIDSAVGGDAYIDDLLANVYLQAGDNDKARTFARRSIDRDPSLDAGYWTLLEIALRLRDHEATARLLSTLESTYGWRFENLAGVETYAEFVASPAYEQWRSARVADAR